MRIISRKFDSAINIRFISNSSLLDLIRLIFVSRSEDMNFSVYQNILPFEGKQFYRRMETILASYDHGATRDSSARAFLSAFQNELAEMLWIASGQLYEVFSDTPELVSFSGASMPEIILDLKQKIQNGDIPWSGLLNGRFTAILPFDQEATHVLVFFAHDSPENEQFLSWAFSSIHYALIQHNRQLSLHDTLEQATAVQRSLLPSRSPQYGDFEIVAKSIPAKIVGGDVYDFQKGEADTLWLLIADAAGHGLPAALQARDVVTGLRMGIQKDIHLTLLVEKLNRVIHSSGLASRFISLVLAKLMIDGSLLYVNAGHPAPLLLRNGGFIELSSGGMILGFAPDSFYRAGYVRMEPGDFMILYTDGVIEHMSTLEEEFGNERLQDWMLRWKDEPLELAVENLFDLLQEYGGQRTLRDDATVVLVRRKPKDVGWA